MWATKAALCLGETPSTSMSYDFGGDDSILGPHISRGAKWSEILNAKMQEVHLVVQHLFLCLLLILKVGSLTIEVIWDS